MNIEELIGPERSAPLPADCGKCGKTHRGEMTCCHWCRHCVDCGHADDCWSIAYMAHRSARIHQFRVPAPPPEEGGIPGLVTTMEVETDPDGVVTGVSKIVEMSLVSQSITIYPCCYKTLGKMHRGSGEKTCACGRKYLVGDHPTVEGQE